MKNLFLLVVFAFVCALHVPAQKHETWGCPARDYKCQLAVRSKALKNDPKNPENYFHIGVVYQRSGAHKEAVESFTMYVLIPGVKPELLAEGYNNRGISQRALKRADLAIADYTKALELNPAKSAMFMTNRANAIKDTAGPDQALAEYGRAIAADPAYAESYAQRGVLYAQLKRPDDAMQDYGRSIELDPTYAEPYYNRGVIYSARKEYAKALPDYTKYVSLIDDPVYLGDGYMNRGIAHYYLGSRETAIEDFTKVIELRPKWPNGYRARALIYREMKKDTLADADEKKAAEIKSP